MSRASQSPIPSIPKTDESFPTARRFFTIKRGSWSGSKARTAEGNNRLFFPAVDIQAAFMRAAAADFRDLISSSKPFSSFSFVLISLSTFSTSDPLNQSATVFTSALFALTTSVLSPLMIAIRCLQCFPNSPAGQLQWAARVLPFFSNKTTYGSALDP